MVKKRFDGWLIVSALLLVLFIAVLVYPMFGVIKQAVIMPDGSKKIDLGGEDTINMRMFEATGSGALLLTEALPGVRRYFEPGKEVAVWKDVPELVARTLHYLAHESECSAVAEAGRRRCLAEHSMDDTVKRFMKIIHDNLPG